MPELPEIETIKNHLAAHVIGRRFVAARIYDGRPVLHITPEIFAERLLGKEITRLSRRGKYLVFDLAGGTHLIFHLRMTGALLLNPGGFEPHKRAEFVLDDGNRLVYTDIRRFGTFNLVKDISSVTTRLGLEPLCSDFTPELLGKIVERRKAPVKAVIMNQELIAGIGNMYADEALFAARIHPLRPAGSLKKREVKALHAAIQKVLLKGIKNKGASVKDYRCPDGTEGTAQMEFCVAHRGGEPCTRCGRPIARIVVGGRGTYYCPACQAMR